MSAILFGSISTLADTSELQRDAFNRAFEQHGLDWTWEQSDYADLLTGNGGQDRISDYAAARGEDVDAGAIHATKSALFQQSLETESISARPGVVDTMNRARSENLKVALVTTTSPENVTGLLAALGPDFASDRFDAVLDSSTVDTAKPDPASYLAALEQLGESAEHCVAIEDNVGGVQAAREAGIACIAFPNENTADHDFDEATERVDALQADSVLQLAQSRP